MSTETLAVTKSEPAAVAKREIRVVQDNSDLSYLLDTARYEHTQRIAQGMAAATLMPKHLRGDSPQIALANCFLVVNQALRWGLDPFAVAPETYEVQGKLGFQGKLIAAVVNARAKLKQRLKYTFDGKGEDLTVTVSGTFDGEDEARTITLSVKQAKTQNQMWIKDPEQKLIYSGVTKWARRHAPEIMLGVMTDDDIERIREDQAVSQAHQVGPKFEKRKEEEPTKTVVEAVEVIKEPLELEADK